MDAAMASQVGLLREQMRLQPTPTPELPGTEEDMIDVMHRRFGFPEPEEEESEE